MALPSNVGHGTVKGTFIDTAGVNMSGTVTFTPTATRLLNPTAEPEPVTMLPKPVTVTLTDGSFTQSLVATDDEDLNPVGWNYKVDFAFSGAKPASFYINVPEGETVDLAVVAPVSQGNGVMITRGQGVPPWAEEEDGKALVLVNGEPTWAEVAGEVDLDGYVTTDALSSELAGYATTSDLAGKADTEHTHDQSDVTGLEAALSGKVDSSTLEDYVTNSDLSSALSGKANSTHTHEQSDITGLSTALSGKANTSHTHEQSDITGLSTALSGKANTSHTHTASNITDFNTATDARITASTTVVKTTGNQTVGGTKTFSSAPVVPDGAFSIAKTSGLQTALNGKVGSGNASVTGIELYASVDDLPEEGEAGVIYVVPVEG